MTYLGAYDIKLSRERSESAAARCYASRLTDDGVDLGFD